MQILGLLLWLGLLFLVASVTNYFAKKPLMNPWSWFAGSYVFFYVLGMVLGVLRQTPNLAYIAGSFLPITVLAFGIGVWRAPKWKAAKLARRGVREQ